MYARLTEKPEIRMTPRILALILQSPKVGIPEEGRFSAKGDSH